MSEFVLAQTYQPTVRLGNWFEDLCLEQERIRNFKIMRDNGDLLVEKTRHLFDNFHRAVELEAPKEHIRLGAIVQLVPVKMNQCRQNTGIEVMPVLSVIINEHVVRRSQNINEHCELTIAPSVKPCVRNAFKIVTANDFTGAAKDEVLKYGQHFRLECVDRETDPILIYTAPKSHDLTNIVRTTFESNKMGETNLPLGLIRRSHVGPGKMVPIAFTNWFCVHHDPRKRYETEGLPIPSSTPIVITHLATNRNLAAERVCIQTLFGPEFLVSVQNYKSLKGKEGWQNIWMISSGRQTEPTLEETCKCDNEALMKAM